MSTPRRDLLVAALLALGAVAGLGTVLAAPLDAATTAAVTNCWDAALLAWLPMAATARSQRRAGAPGWRSWALLAAGVLSWGLGQVVWTVHETVLRQEPFPSAADVGFLGFPLLACAGLLLLPTGPRAFGSRVRVLLDGLLVAASAGLLSWGTVVSTVHQAGADSRLQLAIALAYPLADLVLGVVVVLALTRAPRERRLVLALLGAGLAVLVVGDSAFMLGVHEGWYTTGSLVDMTWVTGFCLLALAAVADRGHGAVADAGGREGTALTGAARLQPLLPYLVVLPALLFVVLPALSGRSRDRVEVVVSGVLVVLLMLRQFLSVAENQALVVAVAAREAQLRHQAFHDPLTGLANRALFHERVEHAVTLARRDLRPLAVLFVDLDDFKPVNDTYGHGEGDRLLVAVAERLRACTGAADTVARLGGDEFGVLVEDPEADLCALAERLCASLARPFYVGSRHLAVRASVGAASVAGPACLGAETEAVLADADAAMYDAKRSGGGRWSVFTPDLRVEDSADAALERDLQHALRTGALRLAYQGIVDLPTGEVRGVEALLRWDCPQRGAVPPGVFVPVAERSGLIGELGRFVLDAAAAQVAAWHDGGAPCLALHVNASPLELSQPGFADGVLAALARHGVLPGLLVLEVTEGVLVDDEVQALAALHALRAHGVRVALDDFGTGWSSLAQLRRLPVDVLKIDRGFVADLTCEEGGEAVVEAVLRLGAALGLTVVAEGVERADQLEALGRLGCTRAQGFLLTRPAPPADVPWAVPVRPRVGA